MRSEAEEAVKTLMAQVNNDRANSPAGIVLSLHRDQGGEFMSDSFTKHLAEKGVYKTTAAGYEPNAKKSGITSRYSQTKTALPTRRQQALNHLVGSSRLRLSAILWSRCRFREVSSDTIRNKGNGGQKNTCTQECFHAQS